MKIKQFNPCKEAVVFRSKYNTFKEAWNACPRGDWMLWIAYRLKVNIRPLTYAKAKCAETVIHLMKDERSVNVVKTAKRFGQYRASEKELRDAADAAVAAYVASAGYAGYAAYASSAAAYAAYAACASSAADAAADAAAAYAAYAAGSATYAAGARAENLLLTADICRKYLTKQVFAKIKKL